MSFYDRQQGTFDGIAIGEYATARRYNAMIDEWEAYANALKNRLQNAEAKVNQSDLGRVAMAYLIGQLANELEKYAPNHPLVNRKRRVEIVDEVVNKISTGSHVFEPKTGTLKPVIR